MDLYRIDFRLCPQGKASVIREDLHTIELWNEISSQSGDKWSRGCLRLSGTNISIRTESKPKLPIQTAVSSKAASHHYQTQTLQNNHRHAITSSDSFITCLLSFQLFHWRSRSPLCKYQPQLLLCELWGLSGVFEALIPIQVNIAEFPSGIGAAAFMLSSNTSPVTFDLTTGLLNKQMGWGKQLEEVSNDPEIGKVIMPHPPAEWHHPQTQTAVFQCSGDSMLETSDCLFQRRHVPQIYNPKWFANSV